MTVGIVYNEKKEQSYPFCLLLSEALKRRGLQVISGGKINEDPAVYEKSDIIISIGGDGTFLRVASRVIERGTPVFGFNLGSLGFLTEFEKDSIGMTADRIASGDYTIEERSVLKISIDREGERHFVAYAINDCVVTREIDANVCYLEVEISGNKVGTYPSDGIIVSTQTGSTAYSLSAGGPIIEPGNDVHIVTPICSHRMGSRSIVTRPESVVKIRPVVKAKRMRVIADGHISEKVFENDCVICENAEAKIKIIRIDPPNFYRAVAEKLFGEAVERENA